MDEENENLVTKVTKLKISRGEENEVGIDIENIENLTVINEKGEDIRIAEIYEHKKTIIIFLRHILCFTCKEYVDDLVKVPEYVFTNANVQLVLIGCNSYQTMKVFKEETGFQHQIFSDPQCQVYKALGFTTQMGHGATESSSKHVKSNWLYGIMKSTLRAMLIQDFSGNMSQNGGSIIIGPGSMVHFSHIDSSMYGHCSINTLLSSVGAQRVNFIGDQMVEEV